MRLLEKPAPGSFRRQVILTFVVGFFLLIAAFSTYLVRTERDNLHRDSVKETTNMAQALAASALAGVRANDAKALQEAVHAFDSYPELVHAMIVSPSGRVLAHSDPSKTGAFLADAESRALLASPRAPRILEDSADVMDVAVPLETGGQQAGWARVRARKETNAAYLRAMARNSAIFLLVSTLWSLFAATLIANRLGARIGTLVRVAEEVQSGNFATRAAVSPGEDEIALLGNSLNKMLDALARNEQDLRAASLYTRSLIEASLDPLVTISAEGKITDVNRATENATGLNRSQLIGTDFSDYFTEPENALEGYRRVFAEGFVTDYPLTLRHRDGHVADVVYNASLYRDRTGKVAGVFAAARDVTERKKAEEEVRRLNTELEQRVAERTAELESFSYSVSHDLRVPLRAVDGFSRILLEEYNDRLDDEGKRLLGIVRDNTRRMARLIDDILAFSRLGRKEIERRRVDMTALANEAATELAPAMAGREVRLEIGVLPPTEGDASMLRQVWVNLLGNAIKFTRTRAVAQIVASAHAGEGEVVYCVRDNGVGFDMQYAGKLFGVFQRLHGADEFEGTGAGLAIVKRIITRHGGRVWAEGRPNEGAAFCFALPVAPETATTEGEPS